ncbi:hypothetical protein F4212_09050 [Candidatus Poribacteria bacterium]|nr:hypothetical protein [Candidatus Poribacteria bacterium]
MTKDPYMQQHLQTLLHENQAKYTEANAKDANPAELAAAWKLELEKKLRGPNWSTPDMRPNGKPASKPVIEAETVLDAIRDPGLPGLDTFVRIETAILAAKAGRSYSRAAAQARASNVLPLRSSASVQTNLPASVTERDRAVASATGASSEQVATARAEMQDFPGLDDAEKMDAYLTNLYTKVIPGGGV